MNNDHPLLIGIRDGVATSGTESHHWGELRRAVFQGLDAWVGLKAWCAANSLECELAYSQSSKGTQVQFRRRKA